MTKRLNCWEVMKCGREPGGDNEMRLGVCLASVAKSKDGINGGRNGGRYCWTIAGTFCGLDRCESAVRKEPDCVNCSFYRQVKEDEGESFVEGDLNNKS